MAIAYEIRPFEAVNNATYQFYEVSVNGKYLYEEFYDNLKDEAKDKKKILNIIAYMNTFGKFLLPEKKFRHIKNKDIQNLYEFKKDDIRVYVLLKEPSMFIILGGYKGKQKQDIELVARRFKDFKSKQI